MSTLVSYEIKTYTLEDEYAAEFVIIEDTYLVVNQDGVVTKSLVKEEAFPDRAMSIDGDPINYARWLKAYAAETKSAAQGEQS